MARNPLSSSRRAVALAASAALVAVAVQAALGTGGGTASSKAPPTVCIGTASAPGCLGEQSSPPTGVTTPNGSNPPPTSTQPGATTVVTSTTPLPTTTTTPPPTTTDTTATTTPTTTGSTPAPPPPPPPPPPPGPTGPLVRNDGNRALFLLPNAKPGSSSTTCVTVTYTGKKPVSMRLYGAGGGTGLEGYVDLTITRGTSTSNTFLSCAGFTPDAADYLGAGAGVVFDGTLAAFPTTYGAAVDDPPGAAAAWTKNEAHAYRVRVSVRDDNAAQGLWAYQAFTWEARELP